MVGIYTPHGDVKKKSEYQCALKRHGAIAGALRCGGTENKTGLELRRRAGLKSRRRRHSIIPPTPELFPTGVGKSALDNQDQYRCGKCAKCGKDLRRPRSYTFRTFRSFRRLIQE